MIIFFISDGMLALLFLILFAAGFRSAVSVIEWILSYWWIFAIIIAILIILKVIFSIRDEKYTFFVCDIIRYTAIFYSLIRYATNCLEALNKGGISGIFNFVVEFIAGLFVVAIMLYGTGLCIEASDDAYSDTGKYIGGSLVCVFIAVLDLFDQFGNPFMYLIK